MSRLVTVIDLGSSKIAAAIARIDKDGGTSLLALENLPSRGIAGGDITDINKTVEDISSVMEKLELQSGKKTRNIFVITKGADIKMDISRGMVALSKTPREITKKDVAKCLEIAQMLKLPPDRAIVNKVVRALYIDGEPRPVKNPVGLYGIKLEAEAFIVTANQSKIQNITKCIDHAGFLLEGIYLSSTVSSNSILDEKEKEIGVALLDIGDSLSEALVFKDNILKNFHIIRKGASCKLNTLLQEVRTTFASSTDDFSSIVITGGGALRDGVIEQIEKIFKVPARLGIVKNAGQNLNPQDAVIHTPTVGLIAHIAKEHKLAHAHKNPIHKVFSKVAHIYETYF